MTTVDGDIRREHVEALVAADLSRTHACIHRRVFLHGRGLYTQAPALTRPWYPTASQRLARLAVLKGERVRRAADTAGADRLNDRRARRRGYRVQHA